MSDNIGQPISRLDGRAKVTGAARYAADTPAAGHVHAVLACAAAVWLAQLAMLWPQQAVVDAVGHLVRADQGLTAEVRSEAAGGP